MLREWREQRRLSQLDLAIQADISTRHLSFVETGRARPTAPMILRLSEHLDVPLRERNRLLLAGGYAPTYAERGLDEPELDHVRAALRQVLTSHEPYPALVIDRCWNLIEANSGATRLITSCAPFLLEAPVNVLRLSLHPDGLAPRITNLAQWRGHLLSQAEHRFEATRDPRLAELLAELRGYALDDRDPPTAGGVLVPLRLAVDGIELSFFSLAARVETATDITVEELSIESFYPADAATATALQADRA
jgi:transcriptional regulator with XRE-family HTH domain